MRERLGRPIFGLCLVLLLSVSSRAQEEAGARAREAKQLNEPEQKYDFELSFPVDSDEATNVKDGRRARIESLLQSILLENEALVSCFFLLIWGKEGFGSPVQELLGSLPLPMQELLPCTFQFVQFWAGCMSGFEIVKLRQGARSAHH